MLHYSKSFQALSIVIGSSFRGRPAVVSSHFKIGNSVTLTDMEIDHHSNGFISNEDMFPGIRRCDPAGPSDAPELDEGETIILKEDSVRISLGSVSDISSGILGTAFFTSRCVFNRKPPYYVSRVFTHQR